MFNRSHVFWKLFSVQQPPSLYRCVRLFFPRCRTLHFPLWNFCLISVFAESELGLIVHYWRWAWSHCPGHKWRSSTVLAKYVPLGCSPNDWPLTGLHPANHSPLSQVFSPPHSPLAGPYFIILSMRRWCLFGFFFSTWGCEESLKGVLWPFHFSVAQYGLHWPETWFQRSLRNVSFDEWFSLVQRVNRKRNFHFSASL